MQIDELRLQLKEANDRSHETLAKAQAEKRDLTTEEEADLDGLIAASERIQANIDRLEKLGEQTERLNTSNGRKTAPDQPQPPQRADDADEQPTRHLTQPRPRISVIERGNGGFPSLGEFAYHVRLACSRGSRVDPRLERLASPTIYGNESSGADGGFAVPPDFRTAIMNLIGAEDSLLSRCDQVTTNSNTFTAPVDETTPWQTSGGIQAYWTGEGDTKTQSKPLLSERTVKLNKLIALVPMTDELLEDASAMDAYLRRKAPEKIAFKVNAAILNGTGVGMPLGILRSPALITVAEESGQVASTLVGNNIIKMWSRLYGPCRANAVWIVNQEIEPQLYKLSIPGTDNTGNAVTGWGALVYMPAGGLSSQPYGTLFGRPVIVSQAASALDTPGDIILADLTQYLALLKSGPNPKFDISIHLWFDSDITAFRFVLRIGGMPWWSAAASALNGSNTYSPFVALATRT